MPTTRCHRMLAVALTAAAVLVPAGAARAETGSHTDPAAGVYLIGGRNGDGHTDPVPERTNGDTGPGR